MNLFRSNKANAGERVYLDHAASTPVDSQVVHAMEPYWSRIYGNAGSHHHEGRAAKSAITKARNECAEFIGARPNEVIFTGSGTESNNIAIFGTIGTILEQGRSLEDIHIITSAIEHPSVLDCFKKLKTQGARVTFLRVDQSGVVDLKELRTVLTKHTVLISIMYANNEVGTLEPIAEIGKIVRKMRGNNQFPYFHTDASQAGLYTSVHVDKLGVDFLTLDAQKMYGPKGVGLLYKRNGRPIKPVIVGGSQEFSIRPSTENTPLIVGFAKAFELARAEMNEEVKRLRDIQVYAMQEIASKIPQAVINGPDIKHVEQRLANNVNISIPGIEGEYATITLSEKGIAVGTRSACIGEAGGPSYVLEAMGKSDLAQNSLRFSFGKSTKREHIDRLVAALTEIVQSFDRK